MKKFIFTFGVMLFLIVAITLVPGSTYAIGNFYLSPSSKSVPQGTTFSVAVRVTTPDAINAVQANLSYPADKLDFVSISTSGSAFDLQVESSGGGGQVRLARGLAGTVSGDKLVATVTFRAKFNSGSATISFAAGSEAVNADGTVVLSGGSSGTYTFAPSPPPPPPPDTTPPKISDVKVTTTSFKGATVEWKTDEAASSIVEYGLTTKYGLSAETPGLTKDHKATFSSELLVLGESYHFRVKSADAAGNLVASKDYTFKARGIPVKVKVVDSKGRGIRKAKVTLASTPMTATTDKNGIANFADVTPGKHLVSTDISGRIQAFQIEVKEPTDKEIAAGTAKPQDFQIQLLSTTSQQTRYLAAATVGLLVIIIGLSLLLWSRSKNKPI